jgi:hypothetical protein
MQLPLASASPTHPDLGICGSYNVPFASRMKMAIGTRSDNRVARRSLMTAHSRGG